MTTEVEVVNDDEIGFEVNACKFVHDSMEYDEKVLGQFERGSSTDHDSFFSGPKSPAGPWPPGPQGR